MQSTLTSLINIVVLSFLVVMVLDFVVGLCVKTRRQATQSEQPAEQSIEELPKQPLVEQPKPQSTTLPDLWTSVTEELPQNAASQPLEIELLPVLTPQSKLPPEPIAAEIVKENVQKQPAEINFNPVVESPDRLTFEQVCTDFAKFGFTFERYRSGRHKYRVTNSSDAPCQFKKLQEAVDWLVSKAGIEMNVRESLKTALQNWHPSQHVNVYCTLAGLFRFSSDLADIDPEEDDGFTFVEAIDSDGQACQPNLKDDHLVANYIYLEEANGFLRTDGEDYQLETSDDFEGCVVVAPACPLHTPSPYCHAPQDWEAQGYYLWGKLVNEKSDA